MSTNRFGMFVHWGIYSILADHEQVLARWDMDNAVYEKLASRFNPVDFRPDEWVSLAKKAGMSYICFTAKHHDGFCMWDTNQTEYNIMNSPYGRDILAELSEACRKQDMKLSIYYSNPDWHEPCAYNPLSSHQWKSPDPSKGNREEYIAFVKNQIRELMTNYGPIYTLFWDIPPAFEDKSVNELVRSLQPDILINNRGYDIGDFSTPERTVPDGKRFEGMAEACQSVGEQSWGYRENEDYFTPRFLMSSIDKIMSMGGSYLLNVGPTASGTIPEKSQSIIKRVGKWYTSLEGILEGHEEDTFDYGISGSPYIGCLKNGRTYLHFYSGLISEGVSLRNYPSIPKSIRLLNSNTPLRFEETILPSPTNERGVAFRKVLHIIGISPEMYGDEPPVIEITW